MKRVRKGFIRGWVSGSPREQTRRRGSGRASSEGGSPALLKDKQDEEGQEGLHQRVGLLENAQAL